MVTSPAFADHLIGRHAKTPSIPRPSIRALFGAFGTALEATAEYRRLNGLTDDQLAARGLSRADVARAVFDTRYSD